ncbi:unnamed protein product, partial [Rotaria sp. Silwood2]
PTYERFFGLLGRQLCILKKEYVEYFEKLFQHQYEIVHRLENVKSTNVAKFFTHLLTANAISWSLTKINHRSTDSTSTQYFQDLFPYDSPNNT